MIRLRACRTEVRGGDLRLSAHLADQVADESRLCRRSAGFGVIWIKRDFHLFCSEAKLPDERVEAALGSRFIERTHHRVRRKLWCVRS